MPSLHIHLYESISSSYILSSILSSILSVAYSLMARIVIPHPSSHPFISAQWDDGHRQHTGCSRPPRTVLRCGLMVIQQGSAAAAQFVSSAPSLVRVVGSN
ncbi:unnamed protein product [Pleuronectes platessa]|uniref:Uncharacterized protein n=1 Tax=Pleuronectes platessa TaxID=8262 RepID=A0A9N7TVK2_PLEPL|nr:unnamed protein product [Pleuronectes platessa]